MIVSLTEFFNHCHQARALRDAKGYGGRNQEGASSVDGQQDHQFQEKGLREEGELQEEWKASCCSSEEAQVWT